MPRDARGLGNFPGSFRRLVAGFKVAPLLPRLLGRTGDFIIDSNYFQSRQNTSILATQRYRGGVTSFFRGAFASKSSFWGGCRKLPVRGSGNNGIAVFAVFAADGSAEN